MNVTAASVIINGGVGAGLGGLLGPGGVPTPANTNVNPSLGNLGSTLDFARAGRSASANAGGSIEDYIRQAAQARGIDPEIALRVARSEGGLKDPYRQGEAMLKYGREESYGPFQLHMRQGGVGVRALEAGVDPRTNWRGGVDYGLDEAARKGWGQWFGAAKAGIGNREGLNGARPLGIYNSGVDPAEILKAYEGTSEAVKKLGTVALPATENLDVFGGGLGELGKALGAAGSGDGAGGGFLSIIMKLLGGIGGFASGTEGAPEGWAWVGEKGPELRKVRQGDVIRSSQRSRQMVAESQAANGNAYAPDRAADMRPQFNLTSTIVNNADVEVTRRQEDDGAGGVREEIMIERRVNAAISRPGSAANRTLREGGFSQKGPLR
jgi:hypothetical protein